MTNCGKFLELLLKFGTCGCRYRVASCGHCSLSSNLGLLKQIESGSLCQKTNCCQTRPARPQLTIIGESWCYHDGGKSQTITKLAANFCRAHRSHTLKLNTRSSEAKLLPKIFERRKSHRKEKVHGVSTVTGHHFLQKKNHDSPEDVTGI